LNIAFKAFTNVKLKYSSSKGGKERGEKKTGQAKVGETEEELGKGSK